MWKKIWLTLGSVILMSSMAAANPFAQQTCQQVLPSDWQCVEVPSGASWEWLVPDPNYRDLVQRYNRQNTGLHAGQLLVVPPSYVSWNSIAPFAQSDYHDQLDVIVFDPRRLAWAHYLNGQLMTWGPAVGGQNWCADKNNGRGGPCRTDVGSFYFTEAASPTRRSNAYPVNCGQPGGRRCSPMPYFTRFTNQGQGIHARSMRGENASHGCVGVFEADAIYINGHVRARVGKSGYGYFNSDQLLYSQLNIQFVVLPYDAPSGNS